MKLGDYLSILQHELVRGSKLSEFHWEAAAKPHKTENQQQQK